MSGRRRSIVVPGLAHGGNPIPIASRIGPLIATSGIHGVDPDSGQLSDSTERQVELMFSNLARVLDAAGASLDAVIKLVVTVRAADARSAVNVAWVDCFPDPDARPARQLVVRELGHGMHVQCDALAYCERGDEDE